jgi:hypothetical protein
VVGYASGRLALFAPNGAQLASQASLPVDYDSLYLALTVLSLPLTVLHPALTVL